MPVAADRGAQPYAGFFAVGFFAADTNEAVAEGYVFTGGDAQIFYLEADGAVPGVEPLLHVFFQRGDYLQRRGEGESDGVRGKMRGNARASFVRMASALVLAGYCNAASATFNSLCMTATTISKDNKPVTPRAFLH